MKKIRIILITLLSAALVLVVLGSATATYIRNLTGRYSSVCNITTEDKKWIEEKFHHCNSIEELLVEINDEICNNYTYVNKRYFLGIQSFNFSEFITNKEGLCYDFACFTKNICYYISQSKNWDIQVYVYDVTTKDGKRHSYNFLKYPDKNGKEIRYCTDMTNNLYNHTNNIAFDPYFPLGNLTFDEYAENVYEEFITNKY